MDAHPVELTGVTSLALSRTDVVNGYADRIPQSPRATRGCPAVPIALSTEYAYVDATAPLAAREAARMRVKSKLTSMLAALALAVGATVAFAVPVAADTCTDTCVAGQSVQTPAGLVTVTVSTGNVVTVVLAPTKPNTLLFAVPFAIPPGPPCTPSYCRTSVDTGGAGIVNIDTVVFPQGPLSRFSLPNLVVISIHPPSPCRVAVTGFTVVFTPL
jgi:hypothetical protein